MKAVITELIDINRNFKITAKNIEIGCNTKLGKNIDIKINGNLRIGNNCQFGDNIHIRGNNIFFGSHLYCSGGLRIGGGGRNNPKANFFIGDRCTIHNNFINVCEPVVIGNDVGLSPEVAILTHGYWLSVLEGYPAKFAGVSIDRGVIVGYRSLIMMGVRIGRNTVIGANSVVTKDLLHKRVYAGNPAKFIRRITPLSLEEKKEKLEEIIRKYISIAHFHGINPTIPVDYPDVMMNDCVFDVELLTVTGSEDEETDDFRDYLRKWGLRFYTDRPFKSKEVKNK